MVLDVFARASLSLTALFNHSRDVQGNPVIFVSEVERCSHHACALPA